MEAGIASIEQQTGKKFGDLKNPLLVSVRSGARDSMPGMMDTILNLGLNDQTVEALARRPATRASPGTATAASSRCTATSSSACRSAGRGPRAVRDGHRGAQARALSQDIEDTKLTVDDLKELVVRFKALVKERAGKQFPARRGIS